LTNNVVLDYNLYRSSLAVNSQMVYAQWPLYGGYIVQNVAQILYGWDVHSIEGNPLFVNATAGDFHLATNSPAMTNGVNLSSLKLPGLSQDKEGNPRPPYGPWPLGAYQTSIVGPLPPTGLRVILN
jgi:hypothetical protein